MSEKAEIFAFGHFRVDVLRRALEREGQPVSLSGKAFEILVVLLEQRGEVVDKDALMRQVWPDTAVGENNIARRAARCSGRLKSFWRSNEERHIQKRG